MSDGVYAGPGSLMVQALAFLLDRLFQAWPSLYVKTQRYGEERLLAALRKAGCDC